MFITFKHHLQTSVGVKQVSFHSLRIRHSSLHFRKLFMNHFWQKLSIEHEHIYPLIYRFFSCSINLLFSGKEKRNFFHRHFF